MKACRVLGETADEIIETARRHGFENICYRCETFRETVEKCRDLAEPGDNVLLSTACASWGMFENYEQRGRVFKTIVSKFE